MAEHFKLFVKNMTLSGRWRQKSDEVFGHAVNLQCLIAAIILGNGIDVADAEPLQTLSKISVAAETFVMKRLGSSNQQTTVRAGELDSRLRLALCDRELEGFMRRGARIGSRTVVGVRCSGSKPWKVYLPVDIIVTEKVLVARRTLARSHLLSQEDLLAEYRDVSRLIGGYMTNPHELIGQRLRNSLIAGRIITPAMLQADKVIRRGQSVTLSAQNSRMNIRMSGKALTDGAIGQRIRVENSNSGRVVEGIVRSPEHVEILIGSSSIFSNEIPKVSSIPADTGVNNNDR